MSGHILHHLVPPVHSASVVWDSTMVSTHVLSDTLIAVSFFMLQAALMWIGLRRNDVKYGIYFWIFVASIFVYGLTHVIMIVNFWYSFYALKLIVKAASAIASATMGILMIGFVPRLINLPTITQLRDVNTTLYKTVEELRQTTLSLKTERDEKERAQTNLIQSQKMEAVGQLTGGIAHDFNNLLMGIGGNLELIRNNPTSERIPKWVGTGIDAVSRAAHLTAQLLTFSSRQKLQLKETRLQPLLLNLKDMITRTIGTGIKVIVNACDDVIVNIDCVQLELAIINLAINARDAMKSSGILTITTSFVDTMIEIDVKDTGSGISPDIAGRIFEPFFTTKDIGKGTGLGLSMVYNVANQLGGDVFIKDTSSQGTTVTLSLPVINPPVSATEMPFTTDFVTNAKHIVIVDDERIIRETITDILNSLGYNVTAFEDGASVLSYLENHQPDLLFVDYSMPVMNGAAVAKAARLLYDTLPIVFITGYSDSDQIGDFPVLKKPLGISDMTAYLTKIFPL